MLALSVLIHLPRLLIMTISLVMIFGHNLFDGLVPSSLGDLSWLLEILHVPGTFILFKNVNVHVLYPLIPWIGVMAFGYSMAPLFLRERQERKRTLFKLGIGMIVAFIIVRAINIYGDPHAWAAQKTALYTFLSFINVTKYPPSSQFLLINFSIIFLLLALFDFDQPFKGKQVLLDFGRTPMFYYLIHVPLIHLIAVIFSLIKYGGAGWLFSDTLVFTTVSAVPSAPVGYGWGLPVTYLVWISVVVMLYPLCHWYAGVKKSNPQNKILSYI